MLLALCPLCSASSSFLSAIQFAICNLMLKFSHHSFLGLRMHHYEWPLDSGRDSPTHGDSDTIIRTRASEQFVLITRRRQMPQATQNPLESHSQTLLSDVALFQAISQVTSARKSFSDYHKSAYTKKQKTQDAPMARSPRARHSNHSSRLAKEVSFRCCLR